MGRRLESIGISADRTNGVSEWLVAEVKLRARLEDCTAGALPAECALTAPPGRAAAADPPQLRRGEAV